MRFNKAALLEGFDNACLRGRRTQTAVLHGFGQFFVFNLFAGGFHRGQKGSFGIILGLALLFLLQFYAVKRRVLANSPFRESFHQVCNFVAITFAFRFTVFLGARFVFRLFRALLLFFFNEGAESQIFVALELQTEKVFLSVERDFHFVPHVRLQPCLNKSFLGKVVNLLLHFGQIVGSFAGGDNGKVVSHFAGIDKDEIFVEGAENFLLLGVCQLLRKGVCFLLHGVGQVLRIGTRVGEQFLFVQVLRTIQNLLGAELKTLVAFFLQFGQVEGLLRELLFLLGVDFSNRRFSGRIASRHYSIRFCFFFKDGDFVVLEQLRLETFPSSNDTVVVQFLELLHDCIAFHNQVERRRLHAPY